VHGLERRVDHAGQVARHGIQADGLPQPGGEGCAISHTRQLAPAASRYGRMSLVAISGGTSRRAAGSSGSILSIGSSGSILSIGSTGSILSIGSAGSILSVGSAGSILSVGSVGSLACVLSVASVTSLGSILSGLSRWSVLAWRGRPGPRGRSGAAPSP